MSIFSIMGVGSPRPTRPARGASGVSVTPPCAAAALIDIWSTGVVSLITVNFKCVCVCAYPSSIKGLAIAPTRHHRLTLGALGAHGCWGSFVVWGFFCDASWVCLFGSRSSVLLEVLLGDAFGALLGDPLDDPLATSRVCFWATSWEQLMGCLWVSACGLSGMRVVDLLCPGELFGGAMGVPLGGWGGAFGAALGRYF